MKCSKCGVELVHKKETIKVEIPDRNNDLDKCEFIEYDKKIGKLLLSALEINTKTMKCKYCGKKLTPNRVKGIMPNFKGNSNEPILLCGSIVCTAEYVEENERKKDVTLLEPVTCAICGEKCLGVNGGNYPFCIECVNREVVNANLELVNKIKNYIDNKTGEEKKFLDYFIVWLDTGKDLRSDEI